MCSNAPYLNRYIPKRPEVVLGAGVGEDCAAVKLAEDETLVMSTDPITGTAQDIGTLAIQITANDLASAGAEPVGVLLTVLLPPEIEEPDLREMMQQVEAACAKAGVQVMGGHTEITAVVNQPVISVCGVGKVKDGCLISTGGAKAGHGYSCDKVDRGSREPPSLQRKKKKIF